MATTQFISFINHLLTFNKQMELYHNKYPDAQRLPFRFNISAKVIVKLAELAKNTFAKEANTLHITAPINIFGDIHGQFGDMVRFFEMAGLPSENQFLFMGDYVDRGNNSVEVVALLFALKIVFPDKVWVLRGNHECPEVNALYGLLGECEERFGDDAKLVFTKINEALISLPLCAVINEKIFCVHGGISPHLNKLADIDAINRFVAIPDSGLLCDLLWSDPSPSLKEEWGASARGVSCTFSDASVAAFLRRNRLQLICRAHQLVPDGYRFFANNKLITVFSAPNYCGNCGNDGVVMRVSSNLECSFFIIKPVSNNVRFRNIDGVEL
jgi:serine/threonine-protein phosphatase PP1 catalytic subunit